MKQEKKRVDRGSCFFGNVVFEILFELIFWIVGSLLLGI